MVGVKSAFARINKQRLERKAIPMKTLSRLFALPLLALGLGLPVSGCIVDADAEGTVEPIDGDGLEFEGAGEIED